MRSDRSPTDARAFVVLIVLVVLAILSAVVVAQFSVVTNNTIIGVRSADDAKARAIAESCLTMLQAYADADLGSPIPVGADFDEVLNPNNATNPGVIDGDEFIPAARAGESVVTVPKGLTGLPDFVQRHKWLLVPQTVGAARGACLVRFDDNSDDGRLAFTLPTGVIDDLGEGLTSDVPFKDRDRAIYLSAIGLFPFLPGTAADDAYGAAHARVTLRRLYNTSSTGSPTILAGGDVSGIKGALCTGGVGSISKTVNAFKSAIVTGSGCGCGAIIAEATTPVAPAACIATPTCDCAPVSTATATFDNAALATRLAAAKPPGNWLATNAQFVFDNQSFFPSPPPGPAPPARNIGAFDLGSNSASCKLHYSKTGEVFVWDRNFAAACANYTNDPVERPCTWDAANPGAFVSCAASGQTACWRRVFNGGVGPSDWQPDKNVAIPNVTGAKRWGAVPGAGDYLCGDSGTTAPLSNCSDCTTTGTAAFAGHFDLGGWTFQNTTDADIPSPSYLIVEGATPATPATTTRVNQAGKTVPGVVSMLHVSVIANGAVDVDGDANICGVGCDCSSLGTPPVMTCTLSGAGSVAGEQCTAVRALGLCTASSAPDIQKIVGDMVCGAINNDKDNVCVVGDVAAMSVDPALACATVGTGEPCSGDSHFCWKQKGAVVGDVYSATSFQILKESTFSGSIAGQRSFCSEQDVKIFGNVVLGLNAGFKGSSTRITGAGGISVNALRAMVETAW